MFCFTEQNSYFSFPQSESFRSLKLLFAYFSSEVEVVSRLCPSDVSSSPLFVRLSIVCFNNSYYQCGHEIRAVKLLSRTIYKLPFLLYAAPRCLATVAASPWPRELRLLKRCLNTLRFVRTVHRFAHRSQFSRKRRQVVWEQSKSRPRTAGISLWVRDDGTILTSVCLRIIDISIPDLTLKIFQCRLFAICISPSTCSHRCAFCLRAYVDSFELIFN